MHWLHFPQGLSNDVLISYFTRNDSSTTASVWNAQLSGAANVNPSAQQFFCLKDCSAAAFVLEYPRDKVSWQQLFIILPPTRASLKGGKT
jgi:hypothetical protein